MRHWARHLSTLPFPHSSSFFFVFTSLYLHHLSPSISKQSLAGHAFISAFHCALLPTPFHSPTLLGCLFFYCTLISFHLYLHFSSSLQTIEAVFSKWWEWGIAVIPFKEWLSGRAAVPIIWAHQPAPAKGKVHMEARGQTKWKSDSDTTLLWRYILFRCGRWTVISCSWCRLHWAAFFKAEKCGS